VPSMDFLFRDGNNSRLPVGKSSFDSLEYGGWLSRLWDLYMADPNPVRINILDDHTRLILGGRSAKEGKGTKVYGIVIGLLVLRTTTIRRVTLPLIVRPRLLTGIY
jgi:uncharacterized protein